MSDPIWPESLPTPLLAGYGVSDDLPLIRTKMESGPDRVTRTSTAFMSKVSFSLLLDAAQSQTLRSFFENSANAGADWFEMPISTGAGVANHRVRFAAGLKFQPIDRVWQRVSCKVETDERVITYG